MTTTPLDEAKRALEWIVHLYDDHKTTSQVAQDAYEMLSEARTALANIRALELLAAPQPAGPDEHAAKMRAALKRIQDLTQHEPLGHLGNALRVIASDALKNTAPQAGETHKEGLMRPSPAEPVSEAGKEHGQ